MTWKDSIAQRFANVDEETFLAYGSQMETRLSFSDLAFALARATVSGHIYILKGKSTAMRLRYLFFSFDKEYMVFLLLNYNEIDPKEFPHLKIIKDTHDFLVHIPYDEFGDDYIWRCMHIIEDEYRPLRGVLYEI